MVGVGGLRRRKMLEICKHFSGSRDGVVVSGGPVVRGELCLKFASIFERVSWRRVRP